MTVWLVGAGPGDPGLLTLRGAEVLASADVVVHDRLASAALLDLAPPDAERISVGKAPGNVEMDQDGINALLVEHGRAGKRVVRLKGGDPFVFGRGGEEAEALAAAGVDFEVVPGITSAIAAPAYAGIPVTHRGLSTHVTIVTGHEDPAKGRTDVDWEALARAGGTLVILMGAARIADIAARLVAGGRSADTPVAAVRNGTRPDQTTVHATLATISDADVAAPSAIVVGDVAALDLGWFEDRPLFGRRVAITRAREQASGLRQQLEALGAEVLEVPAIRVEPLAFELPAFDDFAWLVLTSANGVVALFSALEQTGRDARALSPGADRSHRARHGRRAAAVRSPPRPRPGAVRRRGAARRVPGAGGRRRAGAARARRAGPRRAARRPRGAWLHGRGALRCTGRCGKSPIPRCSPACATARSMRSRSRRRRR